MSTPLAKAIEKKFTPVRTSPSILVSPVATGAKLSSPNDPTLIVIFGWMDAALPHIYKYTESYHKLYPGAAQVIVSSSQAVWWKTQNSHELEIAPAVKVLQELGISSSDERVLVHVFSNGGCFELITLSNVLRPHLQNDVLAAIPAKAVIFDSCPGDASTLGGIRAFTAPIRNPILRTLASGIMLAVLGVWFVVNSVLGREDPFVTLHNHLLSPQTIPSGIPKTFICSKTDKLIPYQAVLGFADRAKREGAQVEVSLYEKTAHVNHMKDDPEKYWRIVASTWDKAVGRS